MLNVTNEILLFVLSYFFVLAIVFLCIKAIKGLYICTIKRALGKNTKTVIVVCTLRYTFLITSVMISLF